MFDHLLESSHRDDSNKSSNIGFGQEIKELASIEIHFTHLIWRSGIVYHGGIPQNIFDEIMYYSGRYLDRLLSVYIYVHTSHNVLVVPSPVVQKVVGSIPDCNIPKVVKRLYQ